ncbi:hypothetical protein [Noviherbaspirillum humi]|nr:hypothetical protein [Noviherbaspirillum humi]
MERGEMRRLNLSAEETEKEKPLEAAFPVLLEFLVGARRFERPTT